MFSCLVAPTGQIVTSGAYRGTRGSELLEQELLKRLSTAKFIPAVHNHQPVIAVFYGTVKFAVVNGKPRLRIFANQQLDQLDKESNFIDPQPYVGQDSKFTGVHYPETGSTVAVTGVVELALNVDAQGNLESMQVVSEEPPLLGFVAAAISDFSGAKFIPVFRDGQPVYGRSVNNALATLFKARKLLNVTRCHVHDFRRTLITRLPDLGFEPFLGHKIANHVLSGVFAHYNHNSYEEQRRAALMAWADRLETLVIGKNVAHLHRAA